MKPMPCFGDGFDTRLGEKLGDVGMILWQNIIRMFTCQKQCWAIIIRNGSCHDFSYLSFQHWYIHSQCKAIVSAIKIFEQKQSCTLIAYKTTESLIGISSRFGGVGMYIHQTLQNMIVVRWIVFGSNISNDEPFDFRCMSGCKVHCQFTSHGMPQ